MAVRTRAPGPSATAIEPEVAAQVATSRRRARAMSGCVQLQVSFRAAVALLAAAEAN